MRSCITFNLYLRGLDPAYDVVRQISKNHPNLGRASVATLKVADVGLRSICIPLSLIESVAMAAINLVGTSFSKKFTLKDSLEYVKVVIYIPILLPIRLLQIAKVAALSTYADIKNPNNANSLMRFECKGHHLNDLYKYPSYFWKNKS